MHDDFVLLADCCHLEVTAGCRCYYSVLVDEIWIFSASNLRPSAQQMRSGSGTKGRPGRDTCTRGSI